MARKTIGEGSEVISISLPRELVRLLKDNGSPSKVIQDLLIHNMDVVGEVPYSMIEEYQKELLVSSLKRHLKRAAEDAIAETISGLESVSWQDISKAIQLADGGPTSDTKGRRRTDDRSRGKDSKDGGKKPHRVPSGARDYGVNLEEVGGID